MPKVIEDAIVYQAVIQVVSERGYAGATTKQMAGAANISEVTLFRKYENKAKLVIQAISFIVEQTDFSSATQYTGHIHTNLLRVVQSYQDSAVEHGFFFATLISEISRNPELADALDKPVEFYSLIGDLISRYQKEGVLKKGYTPYLVSALLGPLIFAAMIHGVISSSQLPQRDLSSYVNDFLTGYQTDTSKE